MGKTESILRFARAGYGSVIYINFVEEPKYKLICEDGYKGALYENIVGEALSKCGYPLCYYKRENFTLEEDFFVRTRKSLLPVEVKATRGTAKSLRSLIKGDHYSDIQYGIKLTAGNIGFSDNIFTFPYFCTFLLRRYLAEVEY